MEHDTRTVLSHLEQRVITLDWLVERNPASHLLHEYEALYHDRDAYLVEADGDEAEVRRQAADLVRRVDTAIRLMENLHLSLTT